MTHSIESDLISATIDEKGAELISLYSKRQKQEYLWQGNPDIWGGQAPVLFPIVGRLKDGAYTYKGKSYKMSPHGFVSNAPFVTKGAPDSSITFTYEDTAQTRAIYPFSFKLSVIFSVQWNVLETIYQVENRTKGPMYFSCGSHEGYICPRYEDESFEDYFLEFGQDATYQSLTVSENGLLCEPHYAVIENGKRLPLHYGLFKNDSLVLTNIPTNTVTLASTKSKNKIVIDYEEAPNLVLWTKPNAPYICIEPWDGLPDFEGSDGDITNKPGILRLEEGETYNWRHTISIYETGEVVL